MYLHKHISANNVSIDNFPFQREIAMEAYLIENPEVLSMETDGFKLGELTETHLSQLENYLKERNQILHKFPDIWDTKVSNQPKWIGVMIGAAINPDLMLKIRKGYYTGDEIPIAALTINRYKGKDGNVYVVTDTYFIERVKNKDYTKYIFNGQKYGKSRLALAVIKDFVGRNPTITFSQLSKISRQFTKS